MKVQWMSEDKMTVQWTVIPSEPSAATREGSPSERREVTSGRHWAVCVPRGAGSRSRRADGLVRRSDPGRAHVPVGVRSLWCRYPLSVRWLTPPNALPCRGSGVEIAGREFVDIQRLGAP